MSMSPNNPFEDRRDDQGDVQGPPRRKSGGKGCLIGCSIAGVLGLLVCCGGGAMMIPFGISILTSDYQQQLAGNPVIVEHIGEIESLEMSWSATFEEAQKSDGQGSAAPIAFEVKGSKGSGTLLIQQDQSGGGGGIKSATLVLPDGTRHPIDVSQSPSAVDDLDFDELSDLIDSGDLAVPEPAVPEPAVPEPAGPEPAVPEPAVPEPAVPEPAVP
jgi:hypothetical protein